MSAPLPEVVRLGFLGMQVCVPADFTSEQTEQFANRENPTGIESNWQIVREGHEQLAGCGERVPCESRTGCVHYLLNC